MKPENGNSKLRAAKMVLIAATALMFLGADGRFSKLGHQLICMCGCKQILLECNHVGCAYSERMRNELTTGLAGGGSDSLVLPRFVQKYGNTVWGAPTSIGFNMVAWITPFAMLVLALVNAWLAVSEISPKDCSGIASCAPASDHKVVATLLAFQRLRTG